MRWRWVLLILLLAPMVRSWGQAPKDSLFEAAVQRGITHVYNLEFEAADQDFATLVGDGRPLRIGARRQSGDELRAGRRRTHRRLPPNRSQHH